MENPPKVNRTVPYRTMQWKSAIRLHCGKGPAEVVLPSQAEEVQPATGTADTGLFCHHWISPLHWISPDYWANHWYNPPDSSRTVLIQSKQKGWQNHSGPFTSSTLPLWTVTVWSTLQSSEHQNDQTQEQDQTQFLPSSNPSHEHLTIIMVHTLFIHLYTYLSNAHI